MHQNIQWVRIKVYQLKKYACTSAASVPQFVGFSCSDYSRPEIGVDGYVIFGMVTEEVGLHVCVKIADCRSNSSCVMRPPHIVTDDYTTPTLTYAAQPIIV